MPTLNWNLPGCDREIAREEVDATKTMVAESGTEIRTSAGPLRYRYHFTIRGRTNAASVDEVDSIRSLYASSFGTLDSFTMADPLDNVSLTCRFDGPLQMSRILANSSTGAWWTLKFSVITVVDAT